ncbi:acyl carrier protein [Nocardia uniformis]|uniref:Acyl carrier protein n=1 Tax=Nocardia uniformis TaxID=53432 RepID=A0A849BNS4_9NOCA|nr:acyl carrier protein [Nocardia uniformis]NNH68362.1 acyl carrier protein [Nocardia uniformis]
MNAETVEAALVVAFATRLALDPAEVEPDQAIVDLPGIDSLAMLRVIVDVETVLGIQVPDDTAYAATTVRQLAKLIAEQA